MGKTGTVKTAKNKPRTSRVRSVMAVKQEYISEQQKSTEGNVEAKIKKISFTVYGWPVSKARPRLGRMHAYTPEKTANQEEKIALVYKSIYHGFQFEKDVPLKMCVDFYVGVPKSDSKTKKMKKLSGEIRPTVKNGDLDNEVKLVCDACNKVVYYDDAQIVELEARKFYSENPRTEIVVFAIGGDDGG